MMDLALEIDDNLPLTLLIKKNKKIKTKILFIWTNFGYKLFCSQFIIIHYVSTNRIFYV